MTRRFLYGFVAAAAVFLTFGTFSKPAYAATRTWTGGGADNNWTTSGNWGGTAPVAGDSLIFDSTGVGTRPSPNNNFTAGTSFASIAVSASGYAIGGNSVSLTTGLTADTYSSGSSTVSLIVGGAGSVTMNAAGGTLLLSGVNTFTGGLTIKAGTVQANTSNKALGGTTGTGTVTIGNTSGSANATLVVGTTGLTYANPIVLATGTSGTLTIGNAGTAISTTFSGGITGTNNLSTNANATTGTVTFSTNAINNAGTVTNVGAGTGTVTVSGGIGANVTAVTESSTTSALTVSGALAINASGTTLVNALGTKLLTVSGGVSGTGNLVLNNNSTLASGITISTAAVSNVGTVTNSGSGSGSVLVSAVIDTNVTGAVENSSTSQLTLSGVNTFAGGLTVKAGTVQANTSASALGAGTVTLGDTSGSANASVVVGTTGLTFANPFVLATGTSGTLTIGNTGTAISTTFSGGVTGTNNLTTLSNATTGTVTFSTSAVNNAGTVTNTGAGTGTVTVSGGIGANVTTVTESSTTSALTVSGGVTVNASGTTLVNALGTKVLTVSGGVTGTGNLTLNNNSSLTSGITLSTTSVNNAGTVTNSGSGSGSVLVSAVIGANVTGAVENSSTSQLTLSGLNTFGGGLAVLAGTVQANTSNKALGGNGTGTVTLGDTSGSANASVVVGTTGLTFANPFVLATGTSGTLTIGNTGTAISTTFSGGVTGSNSLTVSASATTGTVTFSTNAINNAGTVTNAGTGTGTVTVSGGIGSNVTSVVENSVTSALTIGTSPITVNAGGTSLVNSSGTKILTVTGGVTGTGNLITKNDSSTAHGITITTSQVNNAGALNNTGTGTGSVLVSAGTGPNVTSVNQLSGTSPLIIPTTVYVDASWVGTASGSDPDGAGPAQDFGADSFATVQGGVTGVIPGGTVYVAAGSYAENVTVTKALTLNGAGAATTTLTSSGASATAITVSGSIGAGATVLIDGFTFNNATKYGVNATSTTVLNQLTVQNCDFTHVDQNGFAVTGTSTGGVPGLANVSLLNDNFVNNGDAVSPVSLGYGDILFNFYNGNVTMNTVHVTGNGEYAGIQIRGASATPNVPASAGTISFVNVIIDGTFLRPTGAVGTFNPGGPGDGLFILEYSSVSAVSFSGVDVQPTTGNGLVAEGLGTQLNIGNTVFSVPDPTVLGTGSPRSSANIFIGANANALVTNVDATAATFTGAADGFAIEDRITGGVDASGLGIVTFQTGATYVTPTSGSIQRGIDAASTGGTVYVAAGTYAEAVDINKANLTVRLAGNVTIHSLADTASPTFVDLQGYVLTLGDAASTQYDGVISGTGGLTKTGSGTTTLTGTNTYTGTTTVSAGTLYVDGSQAGSSISLNGGVLGGNGSVGAVTSTASGGTVSPGDTVGILSSGNVDLSAGSTSFLATLNGTVAGTSYSRLSVVGTVDLTGTVLGGTVGYAPTPGDAYAVILNDSSDPVTGTFFGIAEGAVTAVDSKNFRVTYIGGTGNDVVLTYVGNVDAAQSTLSPTSASITADGSSTQVLTVTAKYEDGSTVSVGGETVTITQLSGTGSIGSVTDNSDGTYTATVTSPVATGSGVFVATLGGQSVKGGAPAQTQATVSYVPGPADAAQSTLSPTSASITADGSSTQVLTVTAKDANGNLLTTGGAAVAITQLSGTGSIGSVTDNSDGTYAATVTSPTLVGSGVFVAALGGQPVKGGAPAQTQATVTYVAGPEDASQSTLSPTSARITADGSSTQVLTVTAKDANGNAIGTGGITVTVTRLSGTGSVGSVTDNSDGTYSATVTSPTLVGSGVFVATLGGQPVKGGAPAQTQAIVMYVPGPADAAQSTLSPTSASITADGSSTQVLTVIARDANGNAVGTGGAAVAITQLSGTGSIGSVTDNSDGTYAATVTSPTLVGSGVFVATLGGQPVKGGAPTQTQAIVMYVPGPADAAQSTLAPTSASITADGASTQILTVIARDANGNAVGVGGATVTITKLSGSGSIGSVTDNSDGTYTATVTSPVATGSGVFVATLGGQSVKGGAPAQTQATVSYVPGPADAAQSTLAPTSASITANGISTQVLTVTAKDANGNAIGTGGASVAITQLSGTGSVGSVTDNSDGTYAATVTSPTSAGSGTFVATLNGQPVKGGTVSQIQSVVTYTAAGGGGGGGGSPTYSATLKSPNGGGTYKSGTTTVVQWTSNASTVYGARLSLSVDGGMNYSTVIATLSANYGSYSWTVPSMTTTSTARIKVEIIDSAKVVIASDVSDANFTVKGTAPPQAHVDDAAEGITVDEYGHRLAPATGQTGVSPFTLLAEPISKVKAGWYVRSPSLDSVYYVGTDGKRHVFWDAQTYFTWSDTWNDVVWVTDATLTTLPLGKPMLPKPGVVLVKVESDPAVYTADVDPVSSAPQLRHVISEPVAVATYGMFWADYVIDLDPTIFSYYGRGADVTAVEDVDLSIMKTRTHIVGLMQ